jgi:hypothetical protein
MQYKSARNLSISTYRIVAKTHDKPIDENTKCKLQLYFLGSIYASSNVKGKVVGNLKRQDNLFPLHSGDE